MDSLRSKVERILLESVVKEVNDRLEQSLHSVMDVLLNVPKANSMGQVESSPLVARPWTMRLEDERRSGFEPLPEEATIWQVFKQPQAKQQLLILGEPGSGKTTSMLEIARELVKLAQADNTQPIPVLVNLSSWKQGEALLDWLVADLKLKYGVRPDLGRELLRADRLLPLLDGLDEVRDEWQADCGLAINQWMMGELERRPAGLVVCCRIEEYETIVRRKLNLGWAVCLQPLSLVQIRQYLQWFDLGVVSEKLEQDITLQDLLQTPLFLSMFGLVASQKLFQLENWQERRTDQARQEYLFDLYWQAVMQRELIIVKTEKDAGKQSTTYGTRALPSQKKVRRALIFAAKGMGTETELLIEQVQPSWLIRGAQKWELRLIFGVIFGVILGVIFVAILEVVGRVIWGVIGGVIGSVIIGVISTAIGRVFDIEPVERISLSFGERRAILRVVRSGVFFGVVVGVFFSVIGGVIRNLPIFGMIVGVVMGVIIGVIRQGVGELKLPIDKRIMPNQGIKNSARNMLFFTLFAVIMVCPLQLFLEVTLFHLLSADLITLVVRCAIAVAVFMLLNEAGGEALLRHISLRIVLWHYSYAPLRYDKLLDYCTERLLLQKIGGRYRFMHRTLQEYFARMELD